MLKATLTLVTDRRQPIAPFELDSPATIVGLAPLELCNLPEVVNSERNREPFHARLADTLFIAIRSDPAMSKSHFCIRLAVGESGENEFFIRDLGSRCGIRVNGTHLFGTAEIELKDDDQITCSSSFVFNLASTGNDLPEMFSEP